MSEPAVSADGFDLPKEKEQGDLSATLVARQ